MKIKTLEEILKKKLSKTEFAILTNLENGDSEIYLLFLNQEIFVKLQNIPLDQLQKFQNLNSLQNQLDTEQCVQLQ